MAVIEIKNLSFKYKNASDFALKNINLKIEEGGFYIICGKSGSGKSTLLRLLKKQIAPNGDMQGEILYRGKNINAFEEKTLVEQIGFLFQDIENQVVCDSVWQELAFGLGNLGYSNEYIQNRVAEVAEYFGISKWYNKNICELSGGAKQLVSIASIVAMNAKVLLLDEPTSMLDPIARKNLFALLCDLNKTFGVTIIMVEHNMQEVFDYATQIVILDNGEIVLQEKQENFASAIKNLSYAKYIGLPEFVEIFSNFCNNEKMPSTFLQQKSWLKSKIENNLNQNCQVEQDNISCDEVLLTAKNLYFRYDKKQNDVVKDASVCIKKGEILSIVGGNGAGKTTFINLLTGVLKPYSGKVIKNESKEQKITVACLPQNPKSLFVEQSVKEELEVMAKMLGKSDKVQMVVKEFELEDILQNHPYDLSGGETQKVAFAKVALSEPNIIILDEPTQGVDKSVKEQIKKYLQLAQKKGVAIVIVTHDLIFASEISQKIAMFFDGKIVSLASSEDFFARNSYYTTVSSLLTREYCKKTYNVKRILKYGGGIDERKV